MNIRHYHLSGRFDRPKEAIVQHMRDRRHMFDLATFTEVGNEAHIQALEAAFPTSWHLIHITNTDHTGECAIAARKSIGTVPVRVVDSGVHQPAPDTSYYRPDGTRVHPGYVVWAVLEAAGVRAYVSVAHMPVHADTRGGLRGLPRRVATYLAWLKGWRRFSLQQRRKYQVKRKNVMMVADWNLNMDYRWVRALLRTYWPAMRVTWRMPIGDGAKLDHKWGTIGRKVIDATVTGARIVARPVVMSDPHDASDHHPYLEKLSLFD